MYGLTFGASEWLLNNDYDCKITVIRVLMQMASISV